jgi:predicted amidohydrolase YtcJ
VLLTNGRVYTLDAADQVVDTVLVREGRIAFAGRRGAVNPAAGEVVLDLGGRAVLPGLTDAHAHLSLLARRRLGLDAGGRRSEAEVAALVEAAARRARPGTWLVGRGWDQNLWPGGRFPTRASLDRAAPHHPVALTRVDGHAVWVNSAALRLAAVGPDTADPPGGRIVRSEDGQPSGLLVDAAQPFVLRLIPPAAADELDRALGEALAECLAKGLTGVHEMGVDLEACAAYRRLIDRGAFPFRNHAAVWQSASAAWSHALERGPESYGDGQLSVAAVKLVVDGALGSRGAALHAPYCDDARAPDNRGLLLLPPEELARLAAEAGARGFQVCVHAIGDRANTVALDALDRALGEMGARGRDHRWRIEHAQILLPADIPRFRALGVVPSMQPIHCISDLPWAAARLGPDRLTGAYAWRTLLATGVVIPAGSDFPVEDPNPFHGLHAGITRRPLTGTHPGWSHDQCMTRWEAVRAFTAWAAWAAHREAELGSLEPGTRADLVVLSEDVFTCPESRIAAIRPVLTLVGGHAFRDPTGLP